MKVKGFSWRGYRVAITNTHYEIRSPEGYLRYELPRNGNTAQDCLNQINRDIEISGEFQAA